MSKHKKGAKQKADQEQGEHRRDAAGAREAATAQVAVGEPDYPYCRIPAKY